VLSHRGVILNIIIWSTTSSQLSHRGGQYTHHMDTPNHWGTTQLSRGERCPNHWGTSQLSHIGERCPITWVCPTLGSLSGRLNSVREENVSRMMSHEATIINNHNESCHCRRRVTHLGTLDFSLLIFYEVNILQQFKEPLLIFLYCHGSQLEFKELFHPYFIIMLGQIFFLEISLELPP
jgi:hypothetical protein